jgi:hypothetical protein
MTSAVTTKGMIVKAEGDLLKIIFADKDDINPPLPEPEPEPNGTLGCAPSVKDGTFDLSVYDIPAAKQPVVTLEQFGGQVGKDSTGALRDAIDSIRGGGTIALGQGMYGLKGSSRFSGLKNVTIAGKGHGSGFFAVDQPWPGSEWRALMEFAAPENLVIASLEIDGRGQKIGHIRYWKDTGTWFAGLWCHDIGGSASGSRQIPLAAIKGSDWSTDHHCVACYVNKGWGDGRTTSGVRGIWGPQEDKGFDGCLWENLWTEDMGHTGLVPSGGKGAQTLVRNCTSIDNKGAGIKTETPVAYRDNNGWLTWFPEDYTVLISRCVLLRNVFHGVQFEGAGTSVEECFMEGNHANGCASFDRNFRNRFRNNVMRDSREAGIWFSSRDARPFGELQVDHNTIDGPLPRGGVAFHPRCTNPRGNITIVENKVQAGKNAVLVTSEIPAHAGYHERNNGPDGEGAQLPE